MLIDRHALCLSGSVSQTDSRAAVTDQALPARVLSAVCRASTGRFWAAGEPPGTARHPDVGLAQQTQPPQGRVPPRVGGCAGEATAFGEPRGRVCEPLSPAVSECPVSPLAPNASKTGSSEQTGLNEKSVRKAEKDHYPSRETNQ